MPQYPSKIATRALASLAFALLLPAAPAQASEVVKLARLVITGKRLSAEPPRLLSQGAPQQLPRVLVEGRRADPTPLLAQRRAAFWVL